MSNTTPILSPLNRFILIFSFLNQVLSTVLVRTSMWQSCSANVAYQTLKCRAFKIHPTAAEHPVCCDWKHWILVTVIFFALSFFSANVDLEMAAAAADSVLHVLAVIPTGQTSDSTRAPVCIWVSVDLPAGRCFNSIGAAKALQTCSWRCVISRFACRLMFSFPLCGGTGCKNAAGSRHALIRICCGSV